MEPSGRNQWQPVANATGRKRVKQTDRQALATHGNGPRAHGKEGVNGSSPLEGLKKGPQMRAFRVLGLLGFCDQSGLVNLWSPCARGRRFPSPASG